MTIIRSLVRKTIKTQNICQAFSLFWDGGFDIDLTSTGVRLWGIKDTTIGGWEYTSCNVFYKTTTSDQQQINFVSPKFNVLKNDLVFDFVICNDRLKQFDAAKEISKKLHLPIIIIDHTATGDLTPTDIMVINRSRKPAISIGCHPMISKAWNCDFTIPYGINIPNTNVLRNNNVLLHGSFNQLVPDHQVIVDNIVKSTNAKLFGYNPTNSNPFTSWQQCHDIFAQTKVYINLSTQLSFSRGLLLAMAYGCAIVTNITELTATILTNKHNCLTFSNIEEIIPITEQLLANEKLRLELGNNAQQTIKKHFPVENFQTSWKELLHNIRGTLFLQ